jgi:hypothetical protein
MKLTTKIILGLLITCLGGSLAFIIGFSRSERTHYNEYSTEHFSIPQDSMATVEVGKFRVVIIEDDDFADFNMNDDNCSFRLIPSTAGAEKKTYIQIPASIKDAINVSNSGDTLFVNIRMRDILKTVDSKPDKYVSGLNLTLLADRVDVINNFRRLKTIVEDFDADTIFIRSAEYVSIRKCRAKVIDYEEVSALHIRDSKIGTVNVDLDVTYDYIIENSEIEVENFTGSGYYDLRTFTAKTVNWTPKNADNANLHLSINGAATVTFKR